MKTSDEFILQSWRYCSHTFVAVQLALYFNELKLDSQVNIVTVLCYFAYNYFFTLHDDA
jgi:hypothetical protein